MIYAAAGCSSSSKPASHINEDCFDIARLPSSFSNISREEESGMLPSALFLAVFDGHGGTNASTFVSQHLKNQFISALQQVDSSETAVFKDLDVLRTLEKSFEQTDRKLYEKVQHCRHELEVNKQQTKQSVCRCRFFLENPCRCMKCEHHAREGTTGTVIVLMNKQIYVANIGDSEAVAFSFDGMVKAKQRLQSSPTPSPEAEKLVQMFLKFKQETAPTFRNVEEKQSDSEETCQNFSPAKSLSFVAKKSLRKTLSFDVETLLGSSVTPIRSSEHKDSFINRMTKLTVVDTPACDSNCPDYLRIRSIARKRRAIYLKQGIKLDDGIKQGKDDRFNYVRFPGAHSLNMTRAFGNFGHKRFVKNSSGIHLDIDSSPIISTPHVKKFNLNNYNGNYFLVLGSDGLWDNLEKAAVFKLVMNYVRLNISKIKCKIEKTERFRDNSDEVNCEILLAVLAEAAAKLLVEKAVRAKKKFDDVTVVIVLFKSILNVL